MPVPPIRPPLGSSDGKTVFAHFWRKLFNDLRQPDNSDPGATSTLSYGFIKNFLRMPKSFRFPELPDSSDTDQDDFNPLELFVERLAFFIGMKQFAFFQDNGKSGDWRTCLRRVDQIYVKEGHTLEKLKPEAWWRAFEAFSDDVIKAPGIQPVLYQTVQALREDLRADSLCSQPPTPRRASDVNAASDFMTRAQRTYVEEHGATGSMVDYAETLIWFWSGRLQIDVVYVEEEEKRRQSDAAATKKAMEKLKKQQAEKRKEQKAAGAAEKEANKRLKDKKDREKAERIFKQKQRDEEKKLKQNDRRRMYVHVISL
ncbi:5'-3' exoribonculease Dhp1 [Pseudohyphozyma bogoriensis]|nr:5'-3' exoribonculease Dhp1 [Pseudohyphozyma bogoriensis]